MDANLMLRLESESRANSLDRENFSQKLEIESLRNSIARDEANKVQAFSDVDNNFGKVFGYIHMLVRQVDVLKNGIIRNCQDIQKLEARVNAFENLMAAIVEKIEKNQEIEHVSMAFVTTMQETFLELKQQVSELKGIPFNEKDFESLFAKQEASEKKTILPSTIVKNYFPVAYREAHYSLLKEFDCKVGYVEKLNNSNGNTFELFSKDKANNDAIVAAAIKFRDNNYHLIPRKDFEAFLQTKTGEEYVQGQLSLISWHTKNKLWGVLGGALEDFTEINSKNNLQMEN